MPRRPARRGIVFDVQSFEHAAVGVVAMRRVMRGSMLTIDRAKKLLAVPSPTVLRVVQVEDDYERKLRVASDILRAMSAAGFRCELRHAVTRH